MQENTRSLAAIFVPIFKEDDTMAKAKYTKGKDGYYATRLWDGTYNPDGTKHRVNLRTKKSSGALEKMVEQFKRDVESRKHIRKNEIPFLDYARQWSTVYKHQKSTNTQAMYNNIVEKHFSALKHVKLSDIDRIHLQLVLNNAKGKERTQQQIRLTFKQVLKSAVADHLFPSNVFEDIFSNTDAVKYTPPEKRTLYDYEKAAVFSARLKDSDKAFLYILYGCGLRRGEALALTVFDINTKLLTLTVNKAQELTNNAPVTKEPKSSNGYRTVPIPSKVAPVIVSYVNARRSSGKTYLFTMRNGKPVTKSSYDKMWLRIVCSLQEESKEPISGLTAHVFRHNYCTNLCYQIPAISIKHIAKLMGDTEKMVLDVYNHILLEKEDAASAVESAMNF